MPSFTYINRQSDRDALEHDGFLTVGDIGYVDADGYLFVSDRRSDLVLSGGVNIYPAEIEAQLITMPGVADCAVFGVPDAEFGQALVAVIQPPVKRSRSQPSRFAHFSRPRLAGFKIPRTIVFRDTLPREDTGKIFKRQAARRVHPSHGEQGAVAPLAITSIARPLRARGRDPRISSHRSPT